MLKISAYLIVCILSLSAVSRAQQKLAIQGTAPKLYLQHTVAAKENWYSIGRIYNISPKDLAPYNATTTQKPLAIGQKIRIPLTTTNFSQDGAKAADEVFVPLYHTVQEKEWMYRISTNYKAPSENIEKWNGVTNNQLRPGMELVVGFLKVKKSQSPLAAQGSSKIPIVKAAAPAAKTVIPPATPEKNTEVITRQETKKDETVRTETKEDSSSSIIQPVSNPSPSSYKGGVFRKQYKDSGGSVTGNAGVFKSTSGWNDGKYYALMNNVPVGTIVKVSFSSTNKSVYAKVLGELPEMKQSLGLSIRISDAAASELGVANNKFYVDVKY